MRLVFLFLPLIFHVFFSVASQYHLGSCLSITRIAVDELISLTPSPISTLPLCCARTSTWKLRLGPHFFKRKHVSSSVAREPPSDIILHETTTCRVRKLQRPTNYVASFTGSLRKDVGELLLEHLWHRLPVESAGIEAQPSIFFYAVPTDQLARNRLAGISFNQIFMAVTTMLANLSNKTLRN